MSRRDEADAREQILSTLVDRLAARRGRGPSPSDASPERELTMADLASLAGLSRATLYRYFPGKQELLKALSDRGVGAPDAPGGPVNRQAQIAAAALHLFATRGFHATTMAQIAEAVGMSPAALYRYFPSKESLIRGFAEQVALPELRQTLVSGAPAAELEGRLLRLVGLVAAFYDDRFDLIIAGICESRTFPEISEMIRKNALGPGLEIIVRFFDEQARSGALRPGDGYLRARALVAMCVGYVLMSRVLSLPGPPLHEAFPQFASLFLYGLVPRENRDASEDGRTKLPSPSPK